MSLKEKMENPACPVTFYEMIPPKAGNAEDWETNLVSIRELAGKVDGINIPEIREECRQGVHKTRLPERIEQIISRNFKPSLRMLAKLTGFYRQLLQARYASSEGSLRRPLLCPARWRSRAQDIGTEAAGTEDEDAKTAPRHFQNGPASPPL